MLGCCWDCLGSGGGRTCCVEDAREGCKINNVYFVKGNQICEHERTFKISMSLLKLFLPISLSSGCLLFSGCDGDVVFIRVHHVGHVPDEFSENISESVG